MVGWVLLKKQLLMSLEQITLIDMVQSLIGLRIKILHIIINFKQEIFSKYFKEQVLKNLDSPHSIILDNAKYHKIYASFLRRRQKSNCKKIYIGFKPKALKSELLAQVLDNWTQPPTLIEQLASEKGQKVKVFTPLSSGIESDRTGMGKGEESSSYGTNI